MWPLFPRPFLGRLSCWTRADMSVGAAPNGRRGRTGAITVHLPAALPSRRLLSITNCPLRWRPRALRAFPRGSANPSPNSARARNGTPALGRPDLHDLAFGVMLKKEQYDVLCFLLADSPFVPARGARTLVQD